MELAPATMAPLEGPYNLDELRLWITDTRKVVTGNSFQVVRLGDLFDELLFGNAEKFKPILGNILDADKQYRFRHDLVDDLSISVINLPNGKMIMGVITPVKADAKFLIDGYEVPIDPVKPTMVIGIQTKDDLDNTGRGLFIVSQASDLVLPPKILTEPQGGAYLEGDVADVIATAIGYKDVIAIKNGDVLDGIKAAALPVPILSDTADIYVFGFVHPKDPNLIAWTKPASIRRGEAAQAAIESQSQSREVEAGVEVILDMDVAGTPPPRAKWIEQINGQDGPIFAGKQIKISAKDTRTFVPVVENGYKVVQPGDVYDESGEFKKFTKRGQPVVITPIKQDATPPGEIESYDDDNDIFKLAEPPSGRPVSDYRIIINGAAPIIPTSLNVNVGDVEVDLSGIEIYLRETDTLKRSASVFNTKKFTLTDGKPVDFGSHIIRQANWDASTFILSNNKTSASTANKAVNANTDFTITKPETLVTGDNAMMGVHDTVMTDDGSELFGVPKLQAYYNGSIFRIFESGNMKLAQNVASEPRIDIKRINGVFTVYVNKTLVYTSGLQFNGKAYIVGVFYDDNKPGSINGKLKVLLKADSTSNV